MRAAARSHCFTHLEPAGTIWTEDYPARFRAELPALAGYVHHADSDVPGSPRRVHHDSEVDVAADQRDATLESVQYSDGFGRLLQARGQAEDVLFGDARFGGGVLGSASNSTSDEINFPNSGARA